MEALEPLVTMDGLVSLDSLGSYRAHPMGPGSPENLRSLVSPGSTGIPGISRRSREPGSPWSLERPWSSAVLKSPLVKSFGRTWSSKSPGISEIPVTSIIFGSLDIPGR